VEINFNLKFFIVLTNSKIQGDVVLKINVHISYPDNVEELQKKASDLLSSILVKKLEPKEVDELVKLLKDDSNKITW